MATIGETAKYVRSKNAGPFWMTIDIFCETPEKYAQLRDSKTIQKDTFAKIYHVDPEKVKIFQVSNLYVVKISVPRPYPQGYRYEKDMHFGQQYVQILDLEL